jgi:hypothetical protein
MLYRFQFDEVVKFNYPATMGMFFLGIAAGCSGENAAVAVLAALFLYVLYKRNKKIPFEPWELIGIIGFLIGFIALIACPGSYKRAQCFDIASKGILAIIKYNFSHIISLKELTRSSLIAIMLFVIILSSYWKQDKVRKSFVAFGCIFLAIIAHFSMLASPFSPVRSTMPSVCFCIIAICNLVKRINYSDSTLSNKLFKIACVCLILYFPKSLYSAIKDTYLTAQSSERIVKHILSERAKGNMDIVIEKPLRPQNIHTANNISPLWSDPEKNSDYAKAFDVNSIRVKDDYMP